MGAAEVPQIDAAGFDLNERRERIKALVLRDGYARIDELTRSMGVSMMTVHRDLDALAHQGYLTKIRGGATANPSALLQSRVTERSAAMQTQKASIAARAAELLSPGQTVFLDDSTTAMTLLPHLSGVLPITVATNFLPIINQLAGVTGIELIVLGGQYNPVAEACFGGRITDVIDHLHADVAFMSTTGVTAGSCYHRSEITITSRAAFMRNSSRSVLLVDHAKFGRPATYRLCGLADFDLVITDSGVDPETVEELRAAGIDIEIAADVSHD